jgi:hypothetical protein
MNILFLGYVIPADEVGKVCGASVAGNKMQLNILKNLCKYEDIDIQSITIYPIAAFPKTKKIFVKHKILNLFGTYFSEVPFYINLPIIKNLVELLTVYLAARKIVKRYEINTILTYNMFPQTSLPALILKKKFGCEIVSIIADLPIDDNVQTAGLKKKLRNVFDTITLKSIQLCDKVVVLNSEAANIYANGIPYIVIEGGIDLEEVCHISDNASTKHNIVYSGSLQEHNGITNLITAMEMVADSTNFNPRYIRRW